MKLLILGKRCNLMKFSLSQLWHCNSPCTYNITKCSFGTRARLSPHRYLQVYLINQLPSKLLSLERDLAVHHDRRLLSTKIGNTKAEWPLQHIRINTCSSLYAEWYEMKVHRSKPLRGVDIDVAYLDTWPTAPPDVPVILALHGIGYSHRFVLPLIPYILKNRVRIVAPNFPGSGNTPMDKDDHFSHSDQEKASFIFDFLNALEISKVDVLISHSAAVYPSAYLIDGSTIVKSLVLLMPGGMEPLAKYWKKMLVYLFVSDFLRMIGLKGLLKKSISIARLFQPGLKMDMDQIDSSVKSLVYVNHQRVGEILEILSFAKFPILMSYAINDNKIGPHIHTVMDKLRISSDVITRFDAKCLDVGTLPRPQNGCYAIVFETGGHEIETAHPRILGEAICDMFRFVHYGNTVSSYVT